MIVSHKHRFIFIKTKKTAGTSIELALSQALGPKDIVTPVSPEDEIKRTRSGGVGPQNFACPIGQWDARDVGRLLFRWKKPIFYNHMPAERLKRKLGNEIWDSYFKFCFERNPWDKVVSYYFWKVRDGAISIDDFIADYIRTGKLRWGGSELYSQRGLNLVDKVYQFEELGAALKDISTRIGLGIDLSERLPSTKAATRKPGTNPMGCMSASAIAEIGQLFQAEIERFGYEPF